MTDAIARDTLAQTQLEINKPSARMGNKTGNQAMSAGTGVSHSEYNKNKDQPVKFLQIWLFPNELNIKPNYTQVTLKNIEKTNELYQILSPDKEDQGVWVHQDAWFHLGKFDKDISTTYKVRKEGNGLYVFVLEGNANIGRQQLEKRDGYGIWDIKEIEIKAEKDNQILLMDVPMSLS